ncbi:hypothetical protein [Chitinimonas naiadis]
MRTISLYLIWCACLVAGVFASAWMFFAILAGSPRAWRLAIAFDQTANAATGGSEDETISSRANRARLQGRRWGCLLCRLLDRIEKDHCAKSAGV